MNPACSTVSTTADALRNTTLSTNPSSSRLLTLPWEIRQEILKLALPYIFEDWNEDDEPVWCLGSTDVLRTCQQLHVEGTTVLYSLNHLCLVISTDISPENKCIDPYLSFSCLKRCPNCLDDDKSREKCRSDQTHAVEFLDRRLSPESLGMANIILARDWMLEIHEDTDNEVWVDDDGSLHGLWNAEKTQDLVNEVVERYLSQARRLRKVTVVWYWDFDEYAAHPKCVGFREATLKSLKDLGVSIKEIFPWGAECETSGD